MLENNACKSQNLRGRMDEFLSENLKGIGDMESIMSSIEKKLLNPFPCESDCEKTPPGNNPSLENRLTDSLAEIRRRLIRLRDRLKKIDNEF